MRFLFECVQEIEIFREILIRHLFFKFVKNLIGIWNIFARFFLITKETFSSFRSKNLILSTILVVKSSLNIFEEGFSRKKRDFCVSLKQRVCFFFVICEFVLKNAFFWVFQNEACMEKWLSICFLWFEWEEIASLQLLLGV